MGTPGCMTNTFIMLNWQDANVWGKRLLFARIQDLSMF